MPPFRWSELKTEASGPAVARAPALYRWDEMGSDFIRPEAIFGQVFRFLPLLLLVLGVVTYLPESYLWTVRLFGP